MVSCTTQGWSHVYLARSAIHIHVHEYVETNRDLIGLYSIRRQRLNEVPKTSPMRLIMTVDYPERVRTARCEKKIMSPYSILKHCKHYIASVTIKLVSSGKKDRVSIVDRTT